MKKIYLFGLVITLLLGGCVSTVKTYDAHGNLTGRCEASKGFLLSGSAVCYGYANHVTENDVNNMQDLPDQYRITLGK